MNIRQTPIPVLLALAILALCVGCATSPVAYSAKTPAAEPEPTVEAAPQPNPILERPKGSKFEQDRWAILQQAGEYKVTFDFLETVGLRQGYELKKPYTSRAKEVVIVVENSDRRISLQHVLTVPGRGIIKHWNQTWVYEPTMIYEFQGHNTWAPKAISPEEAKGAWSQTVTQVDDSPRYSGVGTWHHFGNLSDWESRAARPLPRREYTKRSDYHVLVARNRHTLIPQGWIHEQDNYKKTLDEVEEPIIAREVGFNVYARTSTVDFTEAYTYWKETGPFWAAVRDFWSETLDGKRTVTLREKWNKKKLFRHMFGLAEESRAGEEATAKAIATMKEVLGHFLSPEEEAPVSDAPSQSSSKNSK